MKNKLSVHHSSKYSEWETPKNLFDKLDKEFKFDIDLCATLKNTKCAVYVTNIFDQSHDDLFKDNACFVNPPYGREIVKFIKRFWDISRLTTVVCLLPARTDTKWWSVFWDHEKHKPRPGVEVRFLKGRLTFEIEGKPVLDKSGRSMPAPFPSAIVILDRRDIS